MFSSNSSQVSDEKLYSEDVFSTFVYTGNGSSQTIINGIDLSGQGGLVWIKNRTSTSNNLLLDTNRGSGFALFSNLTNGNGTGWNWSANSNGFSVAVGGGANGGWNSSGNNYASWTFRKAPKFFDVVTWSGNDVNGRSISHSLGVAPGTIIVKKVNAASSWIVYHRSLGSSSGYPNYMLLQTTDAQYNGISQVWNSAPTATSFSVGNASEVNESGATYVAYLFAHDTTSDGIIQCGLFTGDGTGNSAANALGWEPQALLIKRTDSTGDWQFFDNMRGFSRGATATNLPAQVLYPNLSSAETSVTNQFGPSAKGFVDAGYGAPYTAVYIAIRRGPMRTPTLGTSVFIPIARTGTGASATVSTVGFPLDVFMSRSRNNGTGIAAFGNMTVFDRLRGVISGASNPYLFTPETQQENTISNALTGLTMTGYTLGADGSIGTVNYSGSENYINYAFRRAPSFMDVVCYTGTGNGVVQSVSHNLGVAPEMVIMKERTTAFYSWITWHKALNLSSTYGLLALNSNNGVPAYSSNNLNSTIPTSTAVSVTADGNASGKNYVLYLFASCPGVSKVGSYTGNGSSQTINCGFAAGARFVLIKRTDSTGSWWVWDTARGLVSGNDPALQLNSTAAETTGIDSVDPDSSGFIVNQDATTNINVNAGTYLFFAVA